MFDSPIMHHASGGFVEAHSTTMFRERKGQRFTGMLAPKEELLIHPCTVREASNPSLHRKRSF